MHCISNFNFTKNPFYEYNIIIIAFKSYCKLYDISLNILLSPLISQRELKGQRRYAKNDCIQLFFMLLKKIQKFTYNILFSSY